MIYKKIIPALIQHAPSIPTIQNNWRKHNLPNFALTIKGVGSSGGAIQLDGGGPEFHQFQNNQFQNNQFQNNQFQNGQFHSNQLQNSQLQNNQFQNNQQFQNTHQFSNGQFFIGQNQVYNHSQYSSNQYQPSNYQQGSKNGKNDRHKTKASSATEKNYNGRMGSGRISMSATASGKTRDPSIRWGSAAGKGGFKTTKTYQF